MSKDHEAQSSHFEASLTEDGRYKLLVSSIKDYAIYMLDPTGIVTNWNPGAQRFKGYTADEIVGQHFSRFYTDEDRATSLPARALEIAARNGIFEAEGWRVRKDGTRFWAHVVMDPIYDPVGNLIGYAKVTRDLTERREAERAFRDSEEQFRILVQGVTDYAIYMIDPKGKITNWNAGAQRIKGYAPEEVVGRHFSMFYSEGDRDEGVPQNSLAIAAKEGKCESEGWRVRKDGTKFWAHVVLDAIRNERGDLLGFAKITRDITERRDAQQALDKAREALFQSQKTEAIGQLTGGVAHDFNNLLSAIIGSLEVLQKRLTDPRLIALADIALQGAKRGTALSQRMLAFARRADLKAERIDVGPLVHGMSDLFQRSISPGIALEVRLPVRLPAITADPNEVESALLNLVVNARDAIEDTGQIDVGAREQIGAETRELAAKRFVCLYVSDTGSGMDDETLRRATEPFYTTKGVGKGTGLGLSMAQGLAEQSGGKMVILSKLGQGSTVELWFPAAPRETQMVSPLPTARPLSLVRDQKPLKILAVDDDSLVLMGTVAMLEDLGHTVYSAHSGADALEILRTTPSIELLLTDQAMPKMTGLALANRVHEVRPGLPIIIATGYAELPENQKGFGILGKPFSQETLQAAISSAFGQSPS